jgi:hypothetical protein
MLVATGKEITDSKDKARISGTLAFSEIQTNKDPVHTCQSPNFSTNAKCRKSPSHNGKDIVLVFYNTYTAAT